jgi:Fe2+ or Zn2+ uptake regulation protein
MIRRESVQRRQIMENLKQRCDHPAAAEIYHALRKKNPRISLGTVYRNLDILEKQGRLLCLMLDPHEMRYDAELKPHAHFICKQCRQVFDLTMPEKVESLVQSTAPHGNRIERIHLDLIGVCEKCCQKL